MKISSMIIFFSIFYIRKNLMQSEFFGFIGNPLKFYTISTNNACYTHITYYARRNERTMPREPSPLQAFGLWKMNWTGWRDGLVWCGLGWKWEWRDIVCMRKIQFCFHSHFNNNNGNSASTVQLTILRVVWLLLHACRTQTHTQIGLSYGIEVFLLFPIFNLGNLNEMHNILGMPLSQSSLSTRSEN